MDTKKEREVLTDMDYWTTGRHVWPIFSGDYLKSKEPSVQGAQTDVSSEG